MKSNYKRLGNYIREVDLRNNGLHDIKLLGVSIQKVFMSSIANTIGTDMSTYKMVKRGQFAYGPVTSRNGDKISVALLDEFDDALISQAYTSFEIIDTNELLPEYLMMWFRRPEFDRYARFMSHGSAREIFSWEDMCDVQLPVPSIDKQMEIVKEYHIIVDRIEMNNKLIEKLEETAQMVYKQWFVDFEFLDTNGLTYKSNGGELIYEKTLENEIPEKWSVTTIKGVSHKIITGKTPPTNDDTNYGNDMPFLTIPNMHSKVFAIDYNRYLSCKGADSQKNLTIPKNSICVSCIGTSGLVVITTEACQTNQQINSILLKEEDLLYYLYFTMVSNRQKIEEWGQRGSVGNNMNKSEFESLEILLPDKDVLKKFNKIVTPIFNFILYLQRETLLLEKLLVLINSKMAIGISEER